MTYWSDKFNALPMDVRTIAAAVSNRQMINSLKREKGRLKKRYQSSVKEIDDHIKNCEDFARKNYKENG